MNSCKTILTLAVTILLGCGGSVTDPLDEQVFTVSPSASLSATIVVPTASVSPLPTAESVTFERVPATDFSARPVSPSKDAAQECDPCWPDTDIYTTVTCKPNCWMAEGGTD